MSFGALWAPGGAEAAVSIGASSVSVSAPGAAVQIQRAPFALSFSTGSGGTVLAETGAGTTASKLIAAAEDPVAPGTEPAQSAELYAPLSFLVGSDTITQYDGLVWGGNLTSGVESGVEYSARAVTAATPTATGVDLTLSTTDPSGRVLDVEITPDGTGRLAVAVTPKPAAGVAMMSDAFGSTAGEAFYGFGGRHNALNQHGQSLQSFVQEENLSGVGNAPVGSPATVLFPNGPSAAYYPQAQFVSSDGYGFALNQPELAFFRMDSDRGDAWSVATQAAHLNYVVAPGSFDTAVGSLTAVSGRQPDPPAWALGPQFDRLVKNVGESESDYTANVKADLANFIKYNVPLSAYRIEGWGLPGTGNDGLALHSYISQADQAQTIATLKSRGIHALAYLRPWITPGSAPDKAGYAIHNASGATYTTTTTTGTSIALLDFTNPAAVKWWEGEIDKTLDLGFDGFMSDFGEEILDNMVFADGQTGLTMHNQYLVDYMRVDREAVNAYEASHPGRQIWFFNRAGYSGSPGSAAYEGGNFPGDETTDWGQASGLQSLTPDMLSRAVGGAFGFATDIGGYYDYITPTTTKELFLRWAEWAALSPIFRLHGSGLHGTHTPWSYDGQTISTYDALSTLHEQAAPLIMKLWKQGDSTGIPPTRPLWLEYPTDPMAALQTQEWMLGPQVLVAPVVTQGATSRSVYFPSGCWSNPATGQRYTGPLSTTVAAPLTVLPYYFKCGTQPFTPPVTATLKARGASVTVTSSAPVTSYHFRWQLGVSFGTRTSAAAIARQLTLTAGGQKLGFRITALSAPHGRLTFATTRGNVAGVTFSLAPRNLYFSHAERAYIKRHHIRSVQGLFEIRSGGKVFRSSLTVRI